MGETIRVTRIVLQHILAAAREKSAEECCGLLAGRNGTITRFFPTANAQASARSFEIAPSELFRIFRAMRDAGLDHLGIYHSHPTGDNAPSPRDIEQAFYPGTAYFIVSPGANAPRPIRAFHIIDGAVAELAIEAV